MISTGDDWYKIAFDTTRTPEEGCRGSSCGSSKFLI